jgi:hypothetical protein
MDKVIGKATIIFGVLLLAAGLLSACGGNAAAVTETGISTLLPTASRTAAPTASRSAIPTTTATHTPTSTPATPSPSPTILPSLSSGAAAERLKALLETNGGCPMPCFWGLQAGQSHAQRAREVLEPMKSISTFTAFSETTGNIYLNDFDGNLRFLIEVSFLTTSKQIINLLSFQARAVVDDPATQGVISIYDSLVFAERIKPYSLSALLKELGRPASVQLFTFRELPPHRYGQGHFKVLILYPEQGVLARFTTEMKVIGEMVEGCLEAAHVEVEFLQPRDEAAFIDILARETYWTDAINNYNHLEDVTDLSREEFYSIFSTSKETCLYTPARYWPIAER